MIPKTETYSNYFSKQLWMNFCVQFKAKCTVQRDKWW
jgi:hypothetical protein